MQVELEMGFVRRILKHGKRVVTREELGRHEPWDF